MFGYDWWSRFRCFVYDWGIGGMTTSWYGEVLHELPRNTHLLDVGIGTATSLCSHESLIRERGIRVTGVDYCDSYVEAAARTVKSAGLEEQIGVHRASIYDYDGGPFDAVYFSGSFMILPHPEEALKRCVRMLQTPEVSSEGLATLPPTVYFTQTFEERGVIGKAVAVVKPLLKYVTTIDFGRVTFEEEFREVLRRSNVEVMEWRPLAMSSSRRCVMVSAKPRAVKA